MSFSSIERVTAFHGLNQSRSFLIMKCSGNHDYGERADSTILRKYAILRRTRRHKVMLARNTIATLFPPRAILHFAWCTCDCVAAIRRGVGRAPEKAAHVKSMNHHLSLARPPIYTKASKYVIILRRVSSPGNSGRPERVYHAALKRAPSVGGLCKRPTSRMHAIEVK